MLRPAFALAATLLAASSVQAAPAKSGIAVSQPWSRPAAAGTNGAGFMTLTNNGKQPDTLMSVESTASKSADLHQSSMTNGIMSMKRLDAGLAIAPGQTVTFAPGGYHIMFMGLNQTLKFGDQVPATLVFKSGARVKVDFKVGSGPGEAMDHMHH